MAGRQVNFAGDPGSIQDNRGGKTRNLSNEERSYIVEKMVLRKENKFPMAQIQTSFETTFRKSVGLTTIDYIWKKWNTRHIIKDDILGKSGRKRTVRTIQNINEVQRVLLNEKEFGAEETRSSCIRNDVGIKSLALTT